MKHLCVHEVYFVDSILNSKLERPLQMQFRPMNVPYIVWLKNVAIVGRETCLRVICVAFSQTESTRLRKMKGNNVHIHFYFSVEQRSL